MTNWKIFCLALLSGLLCSTAMAADPAINVGAIEVLATPDTEHLGVYPYVSGSVAFSPLEKVLVIPGIGAEYSPELGLWGFVGTLVLDYAVSDTVGLDVITAFIHDQEGANFGEAAYLLGVGPGVTVLVGDFAVSPSVSLFKGLNVPGWSVVPGLNIAHPL